MRFRRRKKYLRQMKKDMAKAYHMKVKELFGSKAPQSGATIAIDYFREREKERVKYMREWFEQDFKEKYPEYKDLTIKWEDKRIC